MRSNPTLTTLMIGAVLLSLAPAASSVTPLTTKRVASGLTSPTWVGTPPGERDRLFVAEQNSGLIRIVKNGVVQPVPFLDIKAKISSGGERGLLGVAFDPNYAANGWFYVNYTQNQTGATIVERYTVSAGNPDVANPNSTTLILGPIGQPFANHNGGGLAFGLDGYLYVATGDGGSGGDPLCNAQDGSSLLGKLLRLDTAAGGAAPPGNPFVGNPAFDDRIWAYGLRNPWRFSFDRLKGDLYIGDVGQGSREEIDWAPGASTGGENYGWNIMEGINCFSNACGPGIPACNSPALTDPVVDYSHALGCSVTGGHVYRGCAIPDLQGTYFYADFCSARIWSFELVNGQATNHQERTNELAPGGGLDIGNITSFGEDADGEVYIVDFSGGEVFQIVPQLPPPATDLGNGKPGGNGLVPELSVCGLLDTGNTAEVRLEDAAPNALTLLFAAPTANPVPALGGTFVPDAGSAVPFPLITNGAGEWSLTFMGGNGPVDFYVQDLVDDPGATFGVAFSNALKVSFLP